MKSVLAAVLIAPADSRLNAARCQLGGDVAHEPLDDPALALGFDDENAADRKHLGKGNERSGNGQGFVRASFEKSTCDL
jgi:hypothetical protein